MAVVTRTNLSTRALQVMNETAAFANSETRVGSLLRDMIESIVVSGSGDPNGVVTGSPGDLYVNAAGGAGATLWVKESGVATDTGWVAK